MSMAEDPKPPTPPIPSDANDETRQYWDRLDAKFADINTAPRPVPPASGGASDSAAVAEEVAVPSRAPSPPPEPSPASGLIAQAFSALLALEDGQPGAKPVRLTTGDSTPPPAPEPKITDAVIDDIVRRVIERLAPDAARAVVVEVVSAVAERLVKEEIERIRNQHV